MRARRYSAALITPNFLNGRVRLYLLRSTHTVHPKNFDSHRAMQILFRFLPVALPRV